MNQMALAEKQQPQEVHKKVAQYVTFHLGGEIFALPLGWVREIIRRPDVSPIPLGPESLDGIANLRGTILPIVDVHRLLFQRKSVATEATRVVVTDTGHGHLVGLVVDRMERVLAVDENRIESAEQIDSMAENDLVQGVIQHIHGLEMVLVLNLQHLLQKEFATFAKRFEAGISSWNTQTESKKAVKKEEELQLVTFWLAGQEYAFPIERVREIMRVPSVINRIPNSVAHLLGIIDLREHLLPLISLRRTFGMADDPLNEQSRIGVISLRANNEDGESRMVGVLMDRVRQVMRVPVNALEETPSLLHDSNNDKGGMRSIHAICRLQNGKRLVSLLDVEQLFDHKVLEEVMQRHGGNNDQDDKRQHQADRIIQLVVFRLDGEEFGVPIATVQEIIRVPDELTHVPRAPRFIEGMVNLRGLLLPVIDLRLLLGLESLKHNDRQRIMVFNVHGVRTGFIVDTVLEVLKIAERFIEEAPDFSERQHHLMNRVVNLADKKRMIMILEAEHLLEKNQWQALSA